MICRELVGVSSRVDALRHLDKRTVTGPIQG